MVLNFLKSLSYSKLIKIHVAASPSQLIEKVLFVVLVDLSAFSEVLSVEMHALDNLQDIVFHVQQHEL